LKEAWPGVEQIVVSQQRGREMVDLFGIDQKMVRVIPNGIDIPSFHKMESLSVDLINRLSLYDSAPLMLLPVRITRRKNIELALKVVAELECYCPGVKLVVTGPPGAHNPDNVHYFSELKSLRDKLALNGRAFFLAEYVKEFLPASVIADFFRLADLLFLPSFEEGFGLPLLEAALQHIPVFCSDIEVLREVGSGLVSHFDVNSAPEQIARQIVASLEDNCCFRYASLERNEFSWNQVYRNKIKELLNHVEKKN
jgi:glycosyltransferase involved in cell wall biosynthesis